ncbi:MAG: hypothetical protein J5855_02225 [Mailhella sp.]|nr:hypothetical protein [Mailhella sp.]
MLHTVQTGESAVRSLTLYGLPDGGSETEVLDSHGQPILLMPEDAARGGHLPRKAVLVFLRDRYGRICVHASRSGKAGDAVYGMTFMCGVRANESFEEACMRGTAEHFGMTPGQTVLVTHMPFEDSDGSILNTAIYRAGPVWALPLSAEGEGSFLFMDEYELKGMLESFPGMFAPVLAWGIRAGWLFA